MLFAQDPDNLGIVDPNYSSNIPGLSQLEHAELMILFTRFRNLPDSQMIYIDRYLRAGKPLIGVRTATHAFFITDTTSQYRHYNWDYTEVKNEWHNGFGKKVLGETWYTHHGHHKHQSTRGIANIEKSDHPILFGIKNESIWGPTDVYGVRQPLGDNAIILLYGQSIDRSNPYDENDIMYGMRESDSIPSSTSHDEDKNQYNPNKIMPPIAWLKPYQIAAGSKGLAFTSTIGSSTDFMDPEVRKLLVNAALYLTEEKIPFDQSLPLSDKYKPSQYSFRSDIYWDSLNMIINDLNN